MPNWCNNTITIQGPTDTIKPLWEEAQNSGLLNAIKPMPKELEDTTSPTPDDKVQPKVDGFDNWYDWRVANWGTKWDVDTEGLEYKDNGDGTSSITGWFDSAWSPPIGAYETFCDDMDNCDLYATYEEGGMDFAGVWDNGSDDYMEGVTEWSLAVLKGTCSLEDTPELFQKLDSEMDLVEARAYLLDDEQELEETA
jgi:hypothetical protein